MLNVKIKIMKALLKIFFLMAVVSLFAGCNKTNDFVPDKELQLKSAQPVTVEVPFEAELVGEYVGLFFPGDEGFECGEPFNCRVLVDAIGTATHMGKITAHFDFCACGPDDASIPGLDNQYGPTETYFVAANGDKLFLSCQGSVVGGRLPDHPEYVNSYWRDPFIIVGGTGRFAGATVGGMTDDYNSNLDPYSHHHWTGTIKLVKGKK